MKLQLDLYELLQQFPEERVFFSKKLNFHVSRCGNRSGDFRFEEKPTVKASLLTKLDDRLVEIKVTSGFIKMFTQPGTSIPCKSSGKAFL